MMMMKMYFDASGYKLIKEEFKNKNRYAKRFYKTTINNEISMLKYSAIKEEINKELENSLLEKLENCECTKEEKNEYRNKLKTINEKINSKDYTKYVDTFEEYIKKEIKENTVILNFTQKIRIKNVVILLTTKNEILFSYDSGKSFIKIYNSIFEILKHKNIEITEDINEEIENLLLSKKMVVNLIK